MFIVRPTIYLEWLLVGNWLFLLNQRGSLQNSSNKITCCQWIHETLESLELYSFLIMCIIIKIQNRMDDDDDDMERKNPWFTTKIKVL